jgi:Kef-type K+ transport system membrane component KefB
VRRLTSTDQQLPVKRFSPQSLRWPLLAAVVRQRGLAGTVSTAAAGIMDVVAWLALAAAMIGTRHAGHLPLAVVVLLVCGFAAVMLGVVRPALHWWTGRSQLGPGYGISRACGLSSRDSARIAALVNTRGLTELIALNVGLTNGLISPRLFTVLVLMAQLTTLTTGPLLSLIQRRTTAPRSVRWTST